MKKLYVTKNEAMVFNGAKKPALSKATGWSLLLLLVSMLIVGGAYAQAPTLSYSGPQTYKQNVAITPLAPTAGGVAPFAYGSLFVPVSNGGIHFIEGMAFDSNDNLYVGSDATFDFNYDNKPYNDTVSSVEQLPRGGGAAVAYGPVFKKPTVVAVDINNNLYVADLGVHAVYKIPPGGGSAVTLSTAVQNPTGIAVDRLGNVYVTDSQLGNLWKLPAAGGAAVVLGNFGANSLYGIAVDHNDNIYITNNVTHSIIMVPAGGGPQVTIASHLDYLVGLVVDPAGNIFFSDSVDQVKMIPAGGGTPVSVGKEIFYLWYLVLDKYGSLYLGDFFNGTINKINRTGGYFISPNLPPGLNFDENTGIISGTPTLASPATAYTITAYNSSGRTSTTVTITVPSAPHDADLALLKPSPGALSPAFSPSTTSYTIAVVNGVRSLQLTPVTASPQATVTINGAAVADSAASAPIPLRAGADTITAMVTAPDRVTTKTYTLVVNRPGNSNDDLSSLKLSAGTFSPFFTAATTGYTITVANGTREMTVTPTVADPDATIKVNGTSVASGVASPTIPLSLGANTIHIVVTASDGTSVQTYTITVNRPASSNDNLSSIGLSRGTLSPAFSATTTSYTASVANGVTSMMITPRGDPDATITVNGTAVASGTASAAIPLSAGLNTISIAVTASDGSTTQTYTLTVTRLPSGNALLSGLTLSNGVLSPAFSSVDTAYSAGVGIDLPSMTVTPTAADPGATISVNGAAVTSGTASAHIPTPFGVTNINITVTAADGTTSKTYNLTISRGNYDTYLSNLIPSAGTLQYFADDVGGEGERTGFDAYYDVYTDSVKYTDSVFTITPTAGDPNATIKVNGITVVSGSASGAISLAIGSNTISTVVTAQNGIYTRGYVVNVIRRDLGEKSNDNLSSLTGSVTIQNYNENGVFAYYNATAAYGVSSITVTPTAVDSLATIKINGVAVPSGTVSGPISLTVGVNNITITVISEDGILTQNYELKVTRAGSNNANLSAISLSQGVLSPALDATTTSYTVTLPYTAATITVIPATSDPKARIEATGEFYGNNTYKVPLSFGANTMTITVYAASGTVTKTYTLNINREPATNANLVMLAVNAGALAPQFTAANTSYTDDVAYSDSTISLTPTSALYNSTITVNGTVVKSEEASLPIALTVGSNTINIVVTAVGGADTKTYTVTVTRAAGPVNSLNADISVTKPAETPILSEDGIVVHSAVSPNGDGINDFLVIENISQYPDNKLTVVNRNGQLVYEATGYDNSSKVFDGHSSKNGQMQLPGTYFYQLDYTVSGIIKHKTGYLVLKY